MKKEKTKKRNTISKDKESTHQMKPKKKEEQTSI